MDDQEIIKLFQKETSKHAAFQILVKQYQERVYWHIRKMVIDHDDTDDLMQEVFIKVWDNLDKFREDASLFTWIYRIATNECLQYLRKKRKKFFLPLVDVAEELQEKLDNSPHIAGEEVQLLLQKAILTLPDKQRLVFNMKYFDNLSYEAIAAITDTSIGSLKASYHHAVKKIEKFIRDD